MLLREGRRRNFSLVGKVEARTPCFTVDRWDTNAARTAISASYGQFCVPQFIIVFLHFDTQQDSFRNMAQAKRSSLHNHPNLENIDPSHIYYIHSKAAKLHHSTLHARKRLKLQEISVNQTQFRERCPSHARCKPCPPRAHKCAAETVLLKLYEQINATKQGIPRMKATKHQLERLGNRLSLQ